ncbi:uncharacterized protein LOC132757293 isoform X2 [Ruditapes philippinarum]|uniref:uncharacterized protein LOC132757293 isoform X2 n=1 Tax=Ruditapes philippinarum TaxID=129788 RepID=UPI00295A7722|nr:uncharacterized protein LOC132757293 isoform X2 [Ruditapes philippinarum]
MQRLIVDKEVHYGMFGTDTYQPPESISVEHNQRHHLGKLEFAVYRKGGQYKPGMEVALVRINKNRIPIDGKFPSKCATDDAYEFYAGGNCSYSALLNDPYVYKYGSVTGLTKGRVRLQGASVRTSILYGKSLGLDITLHDQIEIEPVDGVAFGELGDSGSLVFQKDGNRLAAFGIFEGKVNDDIFMVTPILEMKQALSELMSRYRDPPTDTQMEVDEQNSAVTFMLYYVPPSSNVSLSAGIDRHISAEISRQTTEIQTNILHHTDHKIGSVKAE